MKAQSLTEDALLARCKQLEGLTFTQLASLLERKIPEDPLQRKGWVGLALELALGANAGNRALPDFTSLSIELKTLPLNSKGKPAESTFITSIPLLTIHQQTWETSHCFAKLRRVLWIPIEDDDKIAFMYRRIGRAVLWSPSPDEASILSQDWLDLSFMLGTGRYAQVDASMGAYLQVRPKAANGRSLCYGFDEEGHKVLTMPRGFYLRSRFTATIL